MTVDEWAIRDTARDLANLYRELDALKHAPPAPREARVMKSRPGPSAPGNWFAIALDRDMTADLFEMVRDAANHIDPTAVIHHQGQWLCEWIKLKSFYIAEDFPAALELHELMHDQARRLNKRLHPPETTPAPNADPYLTADSAQRALANRGLECPAATIRTWAARGHVDTKTRKDGRRAYRLHDILTKLQGTDR